jgi:hypothetical protein
MRLLALSLPIRLGEIVAHRAVREAQLRGDIGSRQTLSREA